MIGLGTQRHSGTRRDGARAAPTQPAALRARSSLGVLRRTVVGVGSAAVTAWDIGKWPVLEPFLEPRDTRNLKSPDAGGTR